MALTKEKVLEYNKRVLLSRARILVNNGFYGLLLMHMKFSVDESMETAATDGQRIIFGTGFLDHISDDEIDFVMMHEILHVALQHCLRTGDRDHELFNAACDIVVNSNILLSNQMDLSTITLKQYGTAMHAAPDGKEGYEYTAEEVYDMLVPEAAAAAGMKAGKDEGDGTAKKPRKAAGKGHSGDSGKCSGDGIKDGEGRKGGERDGDDSGKGFWDNHTLWGTAGDEEILRDLWAKRFKDACEAISVRDPSNQRGLLPLCAVRLLSQMRRPQTDWKRILNDFIQEEVTDYSFTPPDRRFAASEFFLPDYNEKEDMAEDILFMIDTSGSMSDEQVTDVYSEVKAAIDQFGGRLKGWLGFFDAAVVEPMPFQDEADFRLIKPAGGDGTDYEVIFRYVKEHMSDPLPAVIVILTDGYAPFPEERVAMGIPVLWLLNNEKRTPPWGKVTRIDTSS